VKSVGKLLTATVTSVASMIADAFFAGGVAVVAFFDSSTPAGGVDAGSPAEQGYDPSTPDGSSDAGTPGGSFFDPPTPNR